MLVISLSPGQSIWYFLCYLDSCYDLLVLSWSCLYLYTAMLSVCYYFDYGLTMRLLLCRIIILRLLRVEV